MEGFRFRFKNANFQSVLAISASLLVISVISVNGQITTPCTNPMISSFTPCLNFITGSTANGSSPTSDCCGTLKSLMGSSMDCACLLVTANIPFQLPINRTLAISLPRACKLSGVPIQCKATWSPLPAPGPVLLGPTPSPTASAFSPRASKASSSPALAPDSSETMDLTPASSPVGSKTPTANPAIRPVLTPSASNPSSISSSPLLLLFVGILVLFKCY